MNQDIEEHTKRPAVNLEEIQDRFLLGKSTTAMELQPFKRAPAKGVITSK